MFRLKHRKKKRPMAVTFIAWAIFVLFLVRFYQALDPLLDSGILETGLSGPLFDPTGFTPLGRAIFTSAAYASLSLSGIILLIGFLHIKRWSWIVLMIWTAISLTVSLYGYFYGRPNYIILASDTIIALALNQADVQRIFGIRSDPGERLD